jgi:hypothetical protein
MVKDSPRQFSFLRERRATTRWTTAAAVLLLLGCGTAWGAPLLINYQGTLSDPGLAPIATVDLEFRLWPNPRHADDEDEELLWGKRYQVRVEDGRFNVVIGSAGLPDRVRDFYHSPPRNPKYETLDLALAQGPCYVGITVIKEAGQGLGEELEPRQAFLSVPHAVSAERVIGIAEIEEEEPSDPESRFAFSTGEPVVVDMDATEGLAARVAEFPVRAGAMVKISYRATVRGLGSGMLVFRSRTGFIEHDLWETRVVVEGMAGLPWEATTVVSPNVVYCEWVGDAGGGSETPLDVFVELRQDYGVLAIDPGMDNQLLIVEEVLNGTEEIRVSP